MKRKLALLAPVMLLCAAPTVYADSYDCFPAACAHEAPAPEAKINLCEHKAVREVARLDRELKPVKDVYEIAANPTGYAIKLVSEHVVPIPPWVGFAMDPQGAVKAELMKRARKELKKQVGLQQDCESR